MHELTRPDPLNALAGGPPEPVVKPLAPTLSVHDLAGGPPRGREHELADSDIDWIHMPMDTVTGWNKGHCFINMRSALKVFDLYRKLDGRKWVTHPAKKRCKVSYARVQCGTPEYEFVLRGAVAARILFNNTGASPHIRVSLLLPSLGPSSYSLLRRSFAHD